MFIWRGWVSSLLWGWPVWDGYSPGLSEPQAEGQCLLLLWSQHLVGRAAALSSCLLDLGSALLAGLPYPGYLTSLSLCFVLCKVGKRPPQHIFPVGVVDVIAAECQVP